MAAAMPHPDTIQALERAGWTPGRRGDPSASGQEFRALAGRGIVPHGPAAEFLRGFGGLELPEMTEEIGYIDFRVAAALEEAAPPDVAAVAMLTGENGGVCPVGLGSEHVAFVGASGRVYLMHRQWCYYLSFPDADAALDAACGATPTAPFVAELDVRRLPADHWAARPPRGRSGRIVDGQVIMDEPGG